MQVRRNYFALPLNNVVAERTRGDLAMSPVSPRQIPKTSQKVTNLGAESLTVPRTWLFFTSQITLHRSVWRNRLIPHFRVSSDHGSHVSPLKPWASQK